MSESFDVLAQRFFDGQASFLKGCVHPSHFPDAVLPEVAFIGRSNVGKSSLINAVLGRRNLARTSNTPGRTREINYFQITPPKGYFQLLTEDQNDAKTDLYVVDLPGYGYAKSKKDVGSSWEKACAAYLSERTTLKRVFILVDSRHGLKESDRDICRLLDTWAVSYQLVLTKADKLKKSEQSSLIQALNDEIQAQKGDFIACYPEILLTSSSKKAGMETLKEAIYRVIYDPAQGDASS